MIVVTGATGLVGGNLMWYLLQKNERVSAIRRTTSDLNPLRTIFSFYTQTPDVFLSRIDWIIADLLNADSIQMALQNVKTVYHCAAVVSLGNSSTLLTDTNVRGTQNIVDASLKVGVEHFCFVSSIAACGKANGNNLIDEKTPWNENEKRNAYSLSKYQSEQVVWKGIRNGLKAVIVNPGVILGVSGTNSGSSQLFTQVRKGLIFYTQGGSGYVSVQDVAKAMIELMEREIFGERFILVSQNCSNKDVLGWMADGYGKRRPYIAISKSMLFTIGFIAEMLGKLLRFKPLVDRSTARSATNRAYYSSMKIQRKLGFQFQSIEQCILSVSQFERNKNLSL